MLAMDVEMAKLLIKLHPWEAPCAILVTDEGMPTLANELHSEKAYRSMLVTNPGMAARAKELHLLEARCSMLVTEGGIVTFANSLHPQKAFLPRVVTEEGIVTLVTVCLSNPPQCFPRAVPFLFLIPPGTVKCTPTSGDGATAADILFGAKDLPLPRLLFRV